jgi:hypothetical protein
MLSRFARVFSVRPISITDAASSQRTLSHFSSVQPNWLTDVTPLATASASDLVERLLARPGLSPADQVWAEHQTRKDARLIGLLRAVKVPTGADRS